MVKPGYLDRLPKSGSKAIGYNYSTKQPKENHQISGYALYLLFPAHRYPLK
jgi:hypothetical protein